MNSKAKIDFLCIGAQRSGTTWLSHNLRSCPELWIPPIKELHYFSRSTKYDSPSFLTCGGVKTKFFGRSRVARSWRRSALRYYRRCLTPAPIFQKPSFALWGMRYFFANPNDDWYLDLFKSRGGKIAGELTPAYSLLDETDVAGVAALLPDLKIILLMRNPIDRVLSQLRLHLDGRVTPFHSKSNESAMFEFATAEAQMARGNYARTIAKWLRFFPASHIHTAFYEDICEQPNIVLKGVFQFLGVNSATARTPNLAFSRINVAGDYNFSTDLVKKIANVHKPIAEENAAWFGGHALNWCKSI